MSIREEFKKFKGRVKISDIEQAFNKVITYINDFISYINNGIDLLDEESENKIDVTKGSNTLPANEYCLTIGALKQALEVYDKSIIGGVTVKDPLNSNRAIVFPSLLVEKDNGISVIPQTIVNKPSQADIITNPEVGKVIGYDTDNNVVTNQNNVVISEAGWVIGDTITLDNISVSGGSVENIVGDYSIVGYSNEQFVGLTILDTVIELTGSISTSNANGINISYYVDTPSNYFNVTFDSDNRSNDYFYFNTSDCDLVRLPSEHKIYLLEFYAITNDTEIGMFSIQGDLRTHTWQSGGTTILPSGQTNPDIITIADIDWNRDEYVMNTTPDWLFVNPDTSPAVSIMAEVVGSRQTINPDLTKPQFIIPARQGVYRGETGDNIGSVQLTGGKVIFDNNQFNNGSRAKGALETIYAPIWCPKGMANSIVTVYGRSKAFNYRLV